MSLQLTHEDAARVRVTERRTYAASMVAHALLLLVLVRLGSGVRDDGWRLTEVAILEPGDGFEARPAAPAAPAPAAPATQRGSLQPRDQEVRFQRPVAAAEAAPDPQSVHALEDQLNERLATLQRATPAPLPGLATLVTPTPQLAVPAGVLAQTGAGSGEAIALRRGGRGGGSGPPLELARGGRGSSAASALALAQLPAEAITARPAPAPRAGTPPPSLSGVSLSGPIADRPVLEAPQPLYPEWAKAEVVEGSVALHFTVLPDGRVKDNVMVEKTAGFEDFDNNAIEALRNWRFVPLPAGRTGDQWGTITFRFRIAGAR